VKKAIPPEITNAENFYYQEADGPTARKMVILLKDGEEIRGVIEWYDKHALKVHRRPSPTSSS
jgi:hypothetical protein